MKHRFKYDGREVEVIEFEKNLDGSMFATEAQTIDRINDEFEVHEMSEDDLETFNEVMQKGGWQ